MVPLTKEGPTGLPVVGEGPLYVNSTHCKFKWADWSSFGCAAPSHFASRPRFRKREPTRWDVSSHRPRTRLLLFRFHQVSPFLSRFSTSSRFAFIARALSLSFSLCSRCVFDLFLWSWRETRHESIKALIQEKPHNLYQHVRPTCPSLALFHVLCLDSHRILVNKPKRRKGSPYARVDSHATRIVPESLASSSWLAMWSYFNLQILRSSLASLWGWNNLNTHTCISVIKDQGSWRLTRNRRRWVWIRLCELW